MADFRPGVEDAQAEPGTFWCVSADHRKSRTLPRGPHWSYLCQLSHGNKWWGSNKTEVPEYNKQGEVSPWRKLSANKGVLMELEKNHVETPSFTQKSKAPQPRQWTLYSNRLLSATCRLPQCFRSPLEVPYLMLQAMSPFTVPYLESYTFQMLASTWDRTRNFYLLRLGHFA